jgi:fucose 4-O-acetylase-like acetyltransferase
MRRHQGPGRRDGRDARLRPGESTTIEGMAEDPERTTPLGGLRAAAERIDARTPDERDRYADLIRVLAILVVVYGHWLAAVVLVRDGQLVTSQLLVVEPWTRVATWLVQVMPLFFLVGGRVNAGSLRRARDRGQSASAWVRKRARRLLRPMLPLLALWVALAPALDALGVASGVVELAAETAFIPLWFLVVYLLVIVLAPVTWRLHRRGGLAVLAVATPLVALVDALDRAEVPVVGQLNYLLVFAVAHQLGYLWYEDRLPTSLRALPLAGAGLTSALLLVALLGYPLSMVGLQADADSNATPPTLVLVALTLFQLGIVLALRGPAERWLERDAVAWAGVASLGTAIVTVFLWHMTALVIVAASTHLPGWWPQVTEVDGLWWSLRPLWLLLCTVALAPLVLAFKRLETAGDPVPGGPVTTVAGVAATAIGLGLVLTEGLYDAARPLGVSPVALGLLGVGVLCLGVHQRAREPS